MNDEAVSGTSQTEESWRERDAELQSGIDSTFRRAGARPPLIKWSPRPEDITNPLVRSFGAKCLMRTVDGVRVPKSALTLDALGAMAGWCMLLDVEGEDGPFRYAHYGSQIADSFGVDMTGRTTQGFEGHISEFFTTLYREVLARRQWVLSEHEPPSHVFVRSWQRLIVPLVDDDHNVVQLAVANVAENELRAGLDLILDPVFVLDENETIRYANPAAQRFFRFAMLDIDASTMRDLTGISLDLNVSAEHLLTCGEAIDRIVLADQGSLMERLSMTVSAAQHRGNSYYVVIMRPIGP